MNVGGLKHPGRWIWLLLLIPVLLGYTRLKLDVEVLNLLPKDLPVVRGLSIYQEHFSGSRELILTVESEDPEGLENTANAIGAALRSATGLVAQVSWTPPWTEAPAELTEVLALAWLNQPPELFAEMTLRFEPDQVEQRLGEARRELATTLSPQTIARLAYDPFELTQVPSISSGAAGLAMSDPGAGYGNEQLRILFVEPAGDLTGYSECEEWLAAIRREVERVMPLPAEEPALRVSYTGRPAFVAEIARGMERDLRRSVISTALLIAAMFYLVHRRLKPLLWLLCLLSAILAATLGLGGLCFGEVNVISLGFAAILLGLGVDYALVQYHEALARPGAGVAEIRGAVLRGIIGASSTTIAAFLSLNLCGLPGLAQLGTLVAIGVALSAVVLLLEFLPPLRRGEPLATPPGAWSPATLPGPLKERSRVPLVITGVIVAGCALILWRSGWPGVDSSAKPLRPTDSPAYAALERMQTALLQPDEPLWLVVGGKDEATVAARLDRLSGQLQAARREDWIRDYVTPGPLWPHPEHQQANKPVARRVVGLASSIEAEAARQGFSDDALALLKRVFATWSKAARESGVTLPEGRAADSLLKKVAARGDSTHFALILIHPVPGKEAEIAARFSSSQDQVWVTGWRLLGSSVLQMVVNRSWLLIPALVGLAVLAHWVTFRTFTEVALSVAALALSSLCLLAIMSLLRWEWNLMNLVSIPLILGTGVDYSIFMQLALRRSSGTLGRSRIEISKALLLCGGTSMAGFGSLAFSSNAGIASLGPLCALGIALNLSIALVLLPSWWSRLVRRQPASNPPESASALYRSGLWELALRLTHKLPTRLLEPLATVIAEGYRVFCPRRYQVVVENLMPVLDGDASAARAVARRNFRCFSRKLLHLWRYEGGCSVQELLRSHSGWEHVEAARQSGRGILLVTIHLGNWELGSAWLSMKGVDLSVITMAEPGNGFTRQRQEARARWGVTTMVIGTDPFGSLEVVRRLQEGACVALLADRPAARTSVNVQLFGRDFPASIAPAELARATGCVVLPVYIAAEAAGYGAHILPPLNYERATLRNPEARRQFAQQIMRAFEPVISQYPEQWYHFVPVWPCETSGTPPT